MSDLEQADAGASEHPSRSARLRAWLGGAVVLFLSCAALWVLHREFHDVEFRDVRRSLADIPPVCLLLACALTATSYIILTAYDAIALRYLGLALGYPRIALASFAGYVFSHNVGISILGGAAARYRFYSAWGLSAADVGRVVTFTSATFWLGLLSFSGVIFTIRPPTIPPGLGIPGSSLRPIGALFLVIVAVYAVWTARRARPLIIRGVEFPMPSAHIKASQLLVATADWLAAASVFLALVPRQAGLAPETILGAFLLGQTAGLISHVPGGVGVFESVVVLGLSPPLQKEALVGALIAYRMVYYIGPFVLGAVLLGVHELWLRLGLRRASARQGVRFLSALAPRVAAIAALVAGTVLLMSGAGGSVEERLGQLREWLPIGMLEASHFLASLIGVLLLFLARALQRRVDAAWWLTCALLVTGAALSILKGLDYEESLLLLILLAALLPCRSQFYRRATLFQPGARRAFLATAAMALFGSIAFGLFVHHRVELSSELLWTFAFHDDAPRFVRASIGALLLAGGLSIAQLLKPAAARTTAPDAQDLPDLRRIIGTSRRTYAWLALLRDKSILFDAERRGFLMFAVRGRSHIALCDPVGPPEVRRELIWSFRELVDRRGGIAVIYQASAENVDLYLELGLSLQKLGEEARVSLSDFSLAGSHRAELRRAVRRHEQAGSTFEVIEPHGVAPLLDELRGVSDSWLARLNAREKGFSLGFFAPEYLVECPLAVVRRDQRIVAFANLWYGADREELSMDLMRYHQDAPKGVMEYLFARLMVHGHASGFGWLNLGMAPFSGFDDIQRLSPAWNRFGALLFRHGEHFYPFQGLREFKDKFGPEWQPRYLASPGGIALPGVLADVAALISGGLLGMVRK